MFVNKGILIVDPVYESISKSASSLKKKKTTLSVLNASALLQTPPIHLKQNLIIFWQIG